MMHLSKLLDFLTTNLVHNTADLIDQYDLFLIDLWGVMHDGNKPFEGSLRFLNECKKQNKKVVFLSNAPRLPDASVKCLADMGVTPSLYDGIYTSGFDCAMHLKNRPNEFYQSLGTKIYHYGSERDHSLINDLSAQYTIVTSYHDAEVILISSLLKWDEVLNDSAEMRNYALTHHIPIVSANADHTVLKGDDELLCAGAVAQAYKDAGGRTYIHGKPDPNLYALAHQLAGDVSKSKTLMIGDSLRTDIKGAQNYGIDSLMVLTGIFKKSLGGLWQQPEQCLEKVKELGCEYGVVPTYLSQSLDAIP
jgi:HAD superfamily hydrolase (TIGR01459 family)